MKKKNIAVVTATRADYNYFRLIINKIRNSESLNLSLLVTGAHLLESYGKTIDVIKKDGIPITNVIEMYDEKDTSVGSQGKAIGRGIISFTKILSNLCPDLLLLLGDRYEPLAAAIAASTLLIPIAHIHGGDNVTRGQTDEQVRHAITKLAHIHFPATQKSAERIKLLGEEEWRIFNVGSPSIDHLSQMEFLNKQDICKKLELDKNRKIVICIQHPYIIEPELAGEQVKITLKVLKDLNLMCVIIYPNNDPGSNLILKQIDNYKEYSNFKIFKNLDYYNFYSLMQNADLLIGNSSAGIIESPIFKLPVVNIGDRNKGRETGENVIHAIHDYDEIKNAVIKALSKSFKDLCKKVKNPYGNGTASSQIVKILEKIEIDKKLLIKKLTYKV